MNDGRGQKITGFCLLLFAVLYLVLSLRLKMGRPGNPGPGFVPVLIGFALVGSTSLFLLRLFGKKLRDDDADESAPGKGPGLGTLTGVVISMAAYPFLLGPLKFIISTWAACYAMMLVLKPKAYLSSFLLSVGLAMGFFVLFAFCFGVAVPAGPLEEFLHRIGGW